MKKFLMRRLGVAEESSGLKPTLPDCIEAVLEQSGTLVDDVLKGMELALAQAKTKGAGLNQRQINKSVVEQLRQQAAAVRATFAAELRQAIYHSGSQGGGDQPLVRFDDLQMLEEKQLDANIEYAMAQQEVMLAVDDVLPPLNALVSSLLGWLTVQAHLNPLRPDAFARAWRETLVQHVPSEEARSSIITSSAGYLGVSLRQLYKELTDWLRSQGIEPVASMVTAEAGIKPKAENSITRTMLTLDKLRRLLSGELDGAGEGGVKDFLHTVPAPFVAMEDMKLVEPMMKRLSQRASQATVKSGATATSAGQSGQSAEKEKAPGRRLGKQLGEEVVRMMLENLMQDKRLLPKVRQQVKALEPVLLRLSQTDSRFFSERRHPARLLLDKITHRSLAFSSESDEGFALFLQSITASVKALEGSEGDGPSFENALRSLEKRWSLKEDEQRLRREEAARALMHAEQRNLLAHRWAADFQQRFKDKSIPELVLAFLCGPWAHAVAESQLRGADGKGYLDVVDDLVWSVQPSLARRNRARLIEMVPNLLIRLRHGLQLVKYPEEKTQIFLDQLIALHEKSFDVPRAPAPTAAPAPQVEAPAQVPQDSPDSVISVLGLDDVKDGEAFWVADNEASETGYFVDVPAAAQTPDAQDEPQTGRHWSETELDIGSWVELRIERQWVRAQLTWASPHRTLFMFHSAQGEAHSMSRRTMDRLRAKNEMKIVAISHVVDNALDAVAQAALLNNRGSTQE